MVELIPPKFYIVKEDNAVDLENDSKYWVNKKKQKAPKQSVKETTRKAKRLKLDPETRTVTAGVQIETGTGAGGEVAGEQAGLDPWSAPLVLGGEVKLINGFSVENVQSTSLNDLQERLRLKIESLKRKRNTPSGRRDEEGTVEEKAKKRQKRMEEKKRKKELRQKKKNSNDRQKLLKRVSEEAIKRPSIKDETGRIVFNKFDFSTSVQAVEQKDKGPQKKDYKKLLAKAEVAQKKLDELKRKDEKRGEELEKKLQWQKAVDMARGTKLKDDPKLLKKTMKKEDKKKQKSSKEWEKRKELEKQAMEKRQEKRKRNIQERVEQIKAKKMKKRAKKSKIRKPGF